jgi:hypothetical protein
LSHALTFNNRQLWLNFLNVVTKDLAEAIEGIAIADGSSHTRFFSPLRRIQHGREADRANDLPAGGFDVSHYLLYKAAADKEAAEQWEEEESASKALAEEEKAVRKAAASELVKQEMIKNGTFKKSCNRCSYCRWGVDLPAGGFDREKYVLYKVASDKKAAELNKEEEAAYKAATVGATSRYSQLVKSSIFSLRRLFSPAAETGAVSLPILSCVCKHGLPEQLTLPNSLLMKGKLTSKAKGIAASPSIEKADLQAQQSQLLSSPRHSAVALVETRGSSRTCNRSSSACSSRSSRQEAAGQDHPHGMSDASRVGLALKACNRGLEITEIVANATLDRAGIVRVGDILKAVNEKVVYDMQSAKEALSGSQETSVTLKVLRHSFFGSTWHSVCVVKGVEREGGAEVGGAAGELEHIAHEVAERFLTSPSALDELKLASESSACSTSNREDAETSPEQESGSGGSKTVCTDLKKGEAVEANQKQEADEENDEPHGLQRESDRCVAFAATKQVSLSLSLSLSLFRFCGR